MSWTKLPRYFGCPNQVYVTEKIALKNLLKACNGNKPCFVTTYAFPEKNEAIVDKAVFDLDNKFGNLTVPYKDAKSLKDFCFNKNIPHTIVFSGGKGFHFYIHTNPIKCGPEEKTEVKNILYSIQLSLSNHLGLQSLDTNTIGKLRLLIRMPTTIYVNKHLKKNGNWCRWISDKEFDKGLKFVEKLAKQGPGKLPKAPKVTMSFEEITELIPKYELRQKYNGIDMDGAFDLQGGILTPTIDALALPCLKISIKENPSHWERVEIVAWLKLMGYRDMSIVAFFRNVGWKNFNQQKTQANIRTIKARLPKCTSLREVYGAHLCKKCPIRSKHAYSN